METNVCIPMTEMQYAYWVQRNGSNPQNSHVYFEFQTEQIDVDRLKKAWMELHNKQPMLKAVFHKNGTISMDNPHENVINVMDLSGHSKETLSMMLERFRNSTSHRYLHPEKGQLTGLTVCKLNENEYKIILDMDLMCGDIKSLLGIINSLDRAYKGDELSLIQPEEVIDMVKLKKTLEEKNAGQTYNNIILGFLDYKIPEIKKECKGQVGEEFYIGMQYALDKEEYKNLQSKLLENNVSEQAFLLGLYGILVNQYVKDNTIWFNLPVFDRPNELSENTVCDFTNLMYVPVKVEDEMNIIQFFASIEQEYRNRIEQFNYDGIEVQRIIANELKTSKVLFPFIYSYHKNPSLIDGKSNGLFKNLTYTVSQTAQTWLDFQIYEVSGCPYLSLVERKGVFSETLESKHLDKYIRQLKYTLQEHVSWENISVKDLVSL